MDIYSKMAGSLKWSTITEIIAKIITPITNMILARLIAPEEFGVVATVTMVISFTDMLTDAGFQKYIIQHDFEDLAQLDRATSVAFWSNCIMSFSLWGIIILFRDTLASVVGNPELGNVIAIAGISMPLTAVSSMQMARFRRDFQYKRLFLVRFGGLLLPLVVTVPLAVLNFGYWALIIGTICGNLFNAVVLTILSKWRPKLEFDFILLKRMFSYCFWTLLDSFVVWLTTWIDVFVIGTILSDYELGLYRTSLNTVNGIFTLISTSITSVLFSSLSRLQQQPSKMTKVFMKTQFLAAMIVIPMGTGIVLYRELVTEILLGSQWSEASEIIAIWACVSAFRVCFTSLNSELYRASGYPKLPLILQTIDLGLLVPLCYISIHFGFWEFAVIRAALRLDLIIPNLCVLKRKYGVKLIENYKQLVPVVFATFAMSCVALLLQHVSNSIIWSLVSVFICIIVYFTVLLLIPTSRYKLIAVASKIRTINTQM